jgi:hypothetical protein
MGDSMSTIINATTTNGVVIQPDNSGSLVLQTNSGTTALTIDTSQNVAFAKGFTVGATAAPAFSVYKSAAQTLSSATFTKITFNTEEFDTANCFASDKFTPNVAGYYQINGQVSNGTGTQTVATIYKNGANHKDGTNSNSFGAIVSAVIYFNGTTDYVELYGYFATGTTTGSGVASTWFNGAMIRSA